MNIFIFYSSMCLFSCSHFFAIPLKKYSAMVQVEVVTVFIHRLPQFLKKIILNYLKYPSFWPAKKYLSISDHIQFLHQLVSINRCYPPHCAFLLPNGTCSWHYTPSLFQCHHWQSKADVNKYQLLLVSLPHRYFQLCDTTCRTPVLKRSLNKINCTSFF